MAGQVIDVFDLSAYSKALNPEAKKRYIDKLKLLNIFIDPYIVNEQLWQGRKTDGIYNIHPNLEFGDLWAYLVYGVLKNFDVVVCIYCLTLSLSIVSIIHFQASRFYTHAEMKAYKSLEAHQRALNGMVGSYRALKLQDGKVILRAHVIYITETLFHLFVIQ